MVRSAIYRVVFLILGSFLFCSGLPASVLAGDPLKLSTEERAWLHQHRHIRIGMMNAWPPLDFVDKQGKPQGIGVDYVAALNKRLGNVIELVPGPFKQNQEMVKQGHLDGLLDITQRPDRDPFFTFSKPYIVIPHLIVGRKNGPYFSQEQDLVGKTVALEKGFHNITYFKTSFPGVRIREYDSTSAALDAVSRGEADAYAGNRAVAVQLIESELLNNLRLMGKLAGPKSVLQFGVQKKEPLLASILNKALDSISPDEERQIRRKWLQEEPDRFELTSAADARLYRHSGHGWTGGDRYGCP